MGKTLLERRWFRLTAVLIAGTLCAIYFANRPKFPNTTGHYAERIDVGMSYADAIAVLREQQSGDITFEYMKGRTRDGREFSGYGESAFHNLPPAHEIAWVEFNIMDDYTGRELYITIEQPGVVTELRLESDSIWEELRYGLARGTGWSGWKSLTRKRSACFEYTVEHFFSAD